MSADQHSELIQRYFLGIISESEMEELDRRLQGDAALRAEFSAVARLDTNLRDAASSVPATQSDPSPRASRRPVILGIAAAAALLLAIVLFAKFLPGSQSRVPIASISKVSGSMTWIGDAGEMDESLQEGDALTGGTLEVHSLNSWVEIAFTDGSSVWVTGPAVLTISDGEAGKMIRVREGDLSLDVSPQPTGRPLRLITPSAEAIVLGTQFNVSAGSASTSLTVNEGRVRVTRLADGSVQEVAANHRVVAALEQESEFEALPRGDSAHTWKAEFPGDVRQGRWLPDDVAGSGALRAEAHLFRGDRGMRIDPILLHSAVVGPSNEPVILSEGARIRIRGRLERDFKVSIGFGTHFARGGFAGKYSLVRDIDVDAESDGSFELDLQLEEFARKNSRFPESSSGQELVWLWIQTVKQDAGLEVLSVELMSGGSNGDE